LFGANQTEEDKDRKYHREYRVIRRGDERDIEVDFSRRDMDRVKAGEDPVQFCRIYFPNIFYYPFTDDQLAMIKAIADRIHFGGQQAIAAERGGGKSTITKVVGGIWAMVYALIDWVVIVRANARFARDTLDDIKTLYEESELLADDFPDIVQPIQVLEGVAQRAKAQTVDGERSRLIWKQDEVVLPTVEGSPASGSVITAIGVDGAIRGLVRGARRPRLVIGDDIETTETAYSDAANKKNRDILDRDIGGLAGPGRTMAVVLLCTIINRRCIAAEFTDKTIRPEFHGIRQRWIKHFPDHPDLWERYIVIMRDGMTAGDPYGRDAMKYYLEHRAEMDQGVEVSNVNRYIRKELEDGSPIEISSIQSAYNIIANKGLEVFAAEYQNEPPAAAVEAEPIEPKDVQARSNGSPQKLIPSWGDFVTAGIDIGGRQIHYVLVAWREGLVGHIFDYGIERVHSPAGDLRNPSKRLAIEHAIMNALVIIKDRFDSGFKIDQSEKNHHVDLVNVDAGYMEQAIYQFCRTHGRQMFMAVKGYGSNQQIYRQPDKPGGARKIGYQFWGNLLVNERMWLYHVNSDYWKKAVQDGFLLPVGEKGSLTIFGSKFENGVFANQICAEQWEREFKTGKGIIEGFKAKSHDNHYLDALHYAAVGASMLGVALIGAPENVVTQKSISLAALQKMKRKL